MALILVLVLPALYYCPCLVITFSGLHQDKREHFEAANVFIEYELHLTFSKSQECVITCLLTMMAALDHHLLPVLRSYQQIQGVLH